MPKQQKISINLKSSNRYYDIIVGSNILDIAGSVILEKISNKTCLIITDDNIAPLYLQKLEKSLKEANHNLLESIIIPAGEEAKSFNNLINLTNDIFKRKIDRNTLIIALGGGVIGDLTGFASSITLRGLDFIQIPTTLLSQVDSSVGGKTGINSDYGKNTIGAFYQPKLVLTDISTLKTLPSRQILSGYAEVIKYGLIYDKEFFAWCDKNVKNIISDDIDAQTHAIITSCKIKASIVEEDEKESGKRAILNLGHTFGHALENATGYSDRLLHGEAVSIGTIMAFDLSVLLGFCKEEDARTVKNHFKKASLPMSIPKIDASIDDLINLMTQDKKANNGKITMILNKEIGTSFIKKDVDVEAIRKIWEKYF